MLDNTLAGQALRTPWISSRHTSVGNTTQSRLETTSTCLASHRATLGRSNSPDRATRRIDPGSQAADRMHLINQVLSQENENVNQGPKCRGNNSKADRETAIRPDATWIPSGKLKKKAFVFSRLKYNKKQNSLWYLTMDKLPRL